MLETLHWLISALSTMAIVLLVLGAVGSVFMLMRVFRSDFDQPD